MVSVNQINVENKGGRKAARQREIDVLARTIYGEARGELVRGKEAVAAVIMNRVRRSEDRQGYWWGDSVMAVCTKPWQFSCWNEGYPNRQKIRAVGPNNRNFKSCLRIARRALEGRLDDPTHGATHYHTRMIAPPWSRKRMPSAEIGEHVFYNDVE